MRGREPKELGNEIRCNSIQLLLSRHGWRFKTHPVKIRFTDEEEDCSSHSAAVHYTVTTSHPQQLWFISTQGIFRLCLDAGIIAFSPIADVYTLLHKLYSCLERVFEEQLNTAFKRENTPFTFSEIESGPGQATQSPSYASGTDIPLCAHFLHISSDPYNHLNCSLYDWGWNHASVKINIGSERWESCYKHFYVSNIFEKLSLPCTFTCTCDPGMFPPQLIQADVFFVTANSGVPDNLYFGMYPDDISL